MSQNFAGLNLRGKSFKGQNLTAADFSNADIREANFQNATLKGANFSNADIRGTKFQNAKLDGANFNQAKAGLAYSSVVILTIVFLLLSLVAGLIATNPGYSVVYGIADIIFSVANDPLQTQPLSVQTIWIILAITLFFLTTILGVTMLIIWRRWGTLVISAATIVLVVALVLGLATIGIVALNTILAGAEPVIFNSAISNDVVFLLGAGLGALAVAVGFAVILASAWAVAGIGACIIVELGALAGIIGGIWYDDMDILWFKITIGVFSGAIIIMLAHYLISHSFSKENEQLIWLRKVAIAFASLGGTNFKKANLINANFSEAILKNTSFTQAIIMHTCWFNAKQMKLARFSGTILDSRIVRELLVTGKGQNQWFVQLNLQGAYLANADLKNADLTEADLTDANLQNADLKNANLSQTIVLGVDFKWANLTGACLEAWNLDHTTKLEGVRAEYVYLQANQQERRPNSGVFSEGEFSKLFQEILNTVDFIFQNGIDWQAFLVSFEKLKVESSDAEISVQSIEDKGDGVFVIKVNVSPETDKEEFHRDFKQAYEVNKKLLEAKQEQIEDLQNDKIKLLEVIKIQAQAQPQLEIRNIGVEKQKMNDRQLNVGRNMNVTSGGIVNLGKLRGRVTTTIQQLPDPTRSDQPDLKELLTKLQTLIENASESELNSTNKTDALQQVHVLAEAGYNPDAQQRRLGRTALAFFNGIVAKELQGSSLGEEIEQLIPQLTDIYSET